MITVSDVSVRFSEKPLFKDVNLKFTNGNCYGITGANGAGKSSTLRGIIGLVKAKAGSITFEGEELMGASTDEIVKNGITLVPEGRHVFPDQTVLENLKIGAYLRKGNLDEDIENVYKIFPRLKERLWQAAGTLSGGEQQMLAVGRALMANPKLIMMDEPSLGLAPIVVKEIFEIINNNYNQIKELTDGVVKQDVLNRAKKRGVI